MKILIVLTYYRPHTSGLTIYVERLAKALVMRGHQVTILTSQFGPQLPREEHQSGVRILRVPVLMRISKGVIMPSFGFMASRMVLEHDVVHLHLPQFDAAGVSIRGRLLGKPTVITYHCDLTLPPGVFNRVANLVVHGMNRVAALNAHRIVAYTKDFADHSPFLRRYREKICVISPPVELPHASVEQVRSFAQQYGLANHGPVIGMAARLAAEKGVEVLTKALPQILEKYPKAIVLYAGQYLDVLGEEEYAHRLSLDLDRYQTAGNWRFAGVLTPSQMAAFYPQLDALVVPSLNSTESFGLVQIEAMMNGVPVVASDLPGVRQPVLTTGMGEIIPIGDHHSLARALRCIFDEPAKYRRDPDQIALPYLPENTAKEYESMFLALSGR